MPLDKSILKLVVSHVTYRIANKYLDLKTREIHNGRLLTGLRLSSRDGHAGEDVTMSFLTFSSLTS